MNFSVETWAPDYSSSSQDAPMAPSNMAVDVNVECDAKHWQPVVPKHASGSTLKGPHPSGVTKILFIDGVRRIDARVWISGADAKTNMATPGICASYAAGVVCCDGRARISTVALERSLFSSCVDTQAIVTRHATYTPYIVASDTDDQLPVHLQRRMGSLERRVAQESEDADLIVIDGPLSGNNDPQNAVGYVKTHQVAYLPPVVSDVIGELAAGERTPLFLTTTSWSRFSWYLRLPGASSHAWSGIVRCEASADRPVREVSKLADMAASHIVQYASSSHKDPRAPQNLYPIAGLERELRRRLGDPQVMLRLLRQASASPNWQVPTVAGPEEYGQAGL